LKKHYFWTSIAAALFGVATIGVLAYGLGAPTATLLGPALVRDRYLPGGPRQIALTFDDGPSEPYTGQILDILRENHIHATFFLCGRAAERYPELVRRIRAEGHEIGNHTYSHPWLYLMGRDKIAGEIDRTQDVLERISGKRPRLFRPPYGVRWFSLWPILQERNLTLVLWSMRGYGGSGAGGIARTSLEQLQPGGILLLHDGFEARPPAQVDRSDTVRALPAIIAGARKAGYSFALLPGA